LLQCRPLRPSLDSPRGGLNPSASSPSAQSLNAESRAPGHATWWAHLGISVHRDGHWICRCRIDPATTLILVEKRMTVAEPRPSGLRDRCIRAAMRTVVAHRTKRLRHSKVEGTCNVRYRGESDTAPESAIRPSAVGKSNKPLSVTPTNRHQSPFTLSMRARGISFHANGVAWKSQAYRSTPLRYH
jgi:hypothetical protein